MSLNIEPIDLCWIGHDSPATDLCAHGGLLVTMGDEVLLDDSSESWSLGAASLFLLRTLDGDHVSPADDGPLFPCCAFAFFADESGRYINIGGCPNDRDFDVIHAGDSVVLGLEKRPVTITERQWAQAGLLFSSKVRGFYEASDSKEPSNEDAEGWRSFLKEWSDLFELASEFAGDVADGSAG